MVHVLVLVPDALVMDLDEHEVADQHGDEAHHQADAHHDAQVEAEDVSGSQGVGGGRYHAVSGGGTDGQAAGDVAHLLADLGGDGDADGDQDDEGDVEEHGDGQHEAGQGDGPHGPLLGEGGDDLVGDDAGGAAVIEQLAQDDAEADGQADAGHHVAEAGGDGGHRVHHAQAAHDTHVQAGDDHADGGVELQDDDAHQDDGDGDHQVQDQKCGRYHSVVFLSLLRDASNC